jgi:hypothetical protein
MRDAGGGAVTALFRYKGWMVDLTGTLLPDGAALLSGSTQAVESPVDSRVEVTRMVVRPDASGGLGGSFEYVTYLFGLRAFVATRTVTILTGSRRDVTFSPGEFHGFFQGRVAVAECLAGDCNRAWDSSYGEVTFDLAQASSSVIGTTKIWTSPIPSLELAGAVIDGTLHVSGERSDPCAPVYDDYQVCSQRIRDFSATVDELGRLRGSFEYSRDEYVGQRHYAYMVVLEFRTVFRQ